LKAGVLGEFYKQSKNKGVEKTEEGNHLLHRRKDLAH
jgi:hypothetical protein